MSVHTFTTQEIWVLNGEFKFYGAATAELKKLLDKRDAVRSRELLKAVADSPLSYTEIIALIKSGVKPSDDEK